MRLAPLLARYGYWTLLIGAFLEGETVVLLGGFFAHRGELYLPLVMLCAFVGSLAGDQLAYFVGRRFGDRVLDWRPKWRPTAERARHELERRGTFLLVSFRFFYGLRNAVPFVAGVARVPPRRFIPLNAIGALLWAPTISTLGYVFGRAVESALNRARHYEEIALIAILAIGLCLLLIHRMRNRAAARHEHERDAQG